MSAHAPIEASLCQHIVVANLQTPFALRTTRRSAVYACPACLTASAERYLAQPKATPSEFAASVTFSKCDHTTGICSVCLLATIAAAKLRASELYFVDRPASNALSRIAQLWRKAHDPEGYRVQVSKSSPRLTAEERQEQRATEKLRTRRQHIARERGFPSTWALQSKQAERVTVIEPVPS